MPFDTTYYINQNNNNTALHIIVPGGIDTAIFLEPGQLPPHLEPLIAVYDSVAANNYSYAIEDNGIVKPNTTDYGPLYVFAAFLIFFLISKTKKFKSIINKIDRAFGEDEVIERKSSARSYLTYYGEEINFTDAELAAILSKRFPYCRILNLQQQSVFIKRLQKFMTQKVFRIHDTKGFKEMPVLISAAAIQLTFGLKKYLLPHFGYIYIYPQEFLRVRPILCFLEGNVSGHTIKLSWKHFMEGYATPDNGQNVGLHELAHALYYQTFVVERNVDKGFRNYYTGFMIDGNKAFDSEKSKTLNLYSEHAEKNLQEFWAESVEIFFERPAAMRSLYPHLYESMKFILNQDPVNGIPALSS